jgi:hypothetical protein
MLPYLSSDDEFFLILEAFRQGVDEALRGAFDLSQGFGISRNWEVGGGGISDY